MIDHYFTTNFVVIVKYCYIYLDDIFILFAPTFTDVLIINPPYVHTRLPKTEWIVSNTTLEVGLPDELDLAVIPYYFSIRDFLNS